MPRFTHPLLTGRALRQLRDRAYVLRTQSLAEADLIVSLFAENHGRLRGVARSARKSRKRFGGLLEPLTCVRALWLEKEGRELHRIEALEGLRSFAPMQSDPAVQAACAVLAELTEAFAREGEPEPRGFRLLGAVLEALEQGGAPLALVRYYEYWMLRLNGLAPDPGCCAVCHRDLAPGEPRWVGQRIGLRCKECESRASQRGLPFGDRDREFLRAARQAAPGELDDDRGAAAPGRALEALLRGTLESFAERRFRAYRHLNSAAGQEERPWG